MRITGLERRPGQNQITLTLDGRVEILISADVCQQMGLRVGDDLTEPRIESVREAQARKGCLDSALRLLSYRQRTESELRERLMQKRFRPEIVAETISRLRSAGLLDDAQFASSWVDSRNQRAPRSRRLAAAELGALGVTRRVVDDATATIDERDAAYRAAQRRAASLTGSPYAEFRRRIAGLLLRRGFNYEIVTETVSLLWEQRKESRE
jgi:regulatory protein